MRTIKTYKELHAYVNAFGRKKMNLLFIVSKGGLGKTHIAEDALVDQDPLIFRGHVTPLGMYKELLARNENESDFIAIFDDIDALLSNKTSVALLKQICESREDKVVKYITTSGRLNEMSREFETNCKVLVLLNDLHIKDRNISAFMTRAHLVHFEPTNKEILTYLKSFAEDIEIVKFLNQYAPLSVELNLRVYERAKELKEANLDWKDEIVQTLQIDSKLFEISTLMKLYKTDKERVLKFQGSRPTYFRKKKELLSKIPELTNKK